jgi:hypothetical protein
MKFKAMDRRTEMQSILDREVACWSEMTAEQLLNELAEERNYPVESGGKTYRVEVQLLEDRADYVHVLVSVDDGRLRYSIKPLCRGFIQKKAWQRSEHLE